MRNWIWRHRKQIDKAALVTQIISVACYGWIIWSLYNLRISLSEPFSK